MSEIEVEAEGFSSEQATKDEGGEEKRGAKDTGRRVYVPEKQPKVTRRKASESDASQNGTSPSRVQKNGALQAKKPIQEKVEASAQEEKISKPVVLRSEVNVKNGVGHEKKIERPEQTEWDTSGDFASMLDALPTAKRQELEIGNKVRATLIYLSNENAFFSLGQKHEGVMPLVELLDENGVPTVAAGDTIDAFIVSFKNGVELSRKISGNFVDVDMLEEARKTGAPVEGKVTGANKGGLEIALAGAKAFCPIGQVDVGFVGDPSSLIGQTLTFIVTQISANGKNVVLSRRQLLEREKQQAAEKTMSMLQEGATVTAKVVRVVDFGAFATFGGVEGFIPISELGYARVTKATDVLKSGDTVSAKVLAVEPDPKKEGKQRVRLSLKANMTDPFTEHIGEVQPGSSIEGKVVRLESYGAFVELFPGVDGMIHVSELSEQRVKHPQEVLQVGQPVTVRVLEVEPEKRRIALTLRESVERSVKSAEEKPKMPQKKRGDKVDGVVERVERYGVFVRLESGQTALLPASETGLPREADLFKAFPIGNKLSLLIIDIDDRGRLRVSKIARERSEERDSVVAFQKHHKAAQSFTLGDLLAAKRR